MNLSKNFMNLLFATKVAIKLCASTGGRFNGFTVGTEENQGTLAEGLKIGAVCACNNIWDGFAIGYKIVLVWNGHLIVPLNE